MPKLNVAKNSDRVEANSKILETIAKKNLPSSLECNALKISALAYAFVILYHEDKFDEYVSNLWRPLSKGESKKLKPKVP